MTSRGELAPLVMGRIGTGANYLEKNIFLVWSWILQWAYMLETSFSSFISKKPGEIPIFGTFFDEKLNFGLYFTVNR